MDKRLAQAHRTRMNGCQIKWRLYHSHHSRIYSERTESTRSAKVCAVKTCTNAAIGRLRNTCSRPARTCVQLCSPLRRRSSRLLVPVHWLLFVVLRFVFERRIASSSTFSSLLGEFPAIRPYCSRQVCLACLVRPHAARPAAWLDGENRSHRVHFTSSTHRIGSSCPVAIAPVCHFPYGRRCAHDESRRSANNRSGPNRQLIAAAVQSRCHSQSPSPDSRRPHPNTARH
jgi:hypothetical protein